MTIATDSPRQTLEQMIVDATHDASDVLNRWTNGAMRLELGEVTDVPPEEVMSRLGFQDESLVMVLLQLQDEPTGDILLTFAESDARQLAADLLRRDRGNEEWTELEESAITETGNVLGSSYMNAIASRKNLALHPGPPQVFREFAESILEQLLLEHSMVSDSILYIATAFYRESQPLANGNVLFIPSPELKSKLD